MGQYTSIKEAFDRKDYTRAVTWQKTKWLLVEVERLRRIEDAAREWKQDVFRFGDGDRKLDKLSAILGHYPRPEE